MINFTQMLLAVALILGFVTILTTNRRTRRH